MPPARPQPANWGNAAVRHADGLVRCPWPGVDPLYVAYHDTEWGKPEKDSRALYEKLVLDGFQAGLSWITILRKREAFRAAFDGFDPLAVAQFDVRRMHELMHNDAIVRNRAKIEGAVFSARAWIEIEVSPRVFQLSMGLCRRDADHQSSRAHQRHTDAEPDFRAAVQGSQSPWFQILRPDDRLRLHAGGGHGE